MEKKLIRIALVGRGNVATHIKEALNNYNHQYNYVGSYTRSSSTIPEADLYIVSVSDNAISEVTSQLVGSIPADSIVVHTSGGIDINSIDNRITNRGVLYPFQTFSKGVEINFRDVPLFIEGINHHTTSIIEKLASTLSSSVTHCNSTSRLTLHIMGVFACNFTTHILGIVQQLSAGANIPFETIRPLVDETIRKALSSEDIKSIQTGPAIRGDYETINRHLSELSEKSINFAEIYQSLTNSIIKNG